MKLLKTISVILLASVCSSCAIQPDAEVYTVSAEPYSAFVDEDVRSKECRIELGDEVFINGSGAWFGSGGINISESGVYIISGQYNGCISVTAKDPVKLIFSGAGITNENGCAVISGSSRLIITTEGSGNILTGSGSEYAAAVYSEGTLLFGGPGSLSVSGSVFSGGGILFSRNINTICPVIYGDKGDMIYGSLRIN